MTVTQTRARYLSVSAAVVTAGILLSGPLGVALVMIFAPQPQWRDAAVFVRSYSGLQTLPYLFGFLIVGGFVAFMSGLVGTGREEQRPLEIAGAAFTGVFAALVFFNYVLQTAFVPQALDSSEAILAMATMANPRSLGWALELYGYGVLGVATGFAAPLFEGRGGQGAIRILLAVNCVVSVAAAAMVPILPGWALTPGGMAAAAIWNLLILVTMVLVMLELRFGGGSNTRRSETSRGDARTRRARAARSNGRSRGSRAKNRAGRVS